MLVMAKAFRESDGELAAQRLASLRAGHAAGQARKRVERPLRRRQLEDRIEARGDQVALAAATDESRPILTGVLAKFHQGGLTLAAADGFRLAVTTADVAA